MADDAPPSDDLKVSLTWSTDTAAAGERRPAVKATSRPEPAPPESAPPPPPPPEAKRAPAAVESGAKRSRERVDPATVLSAVERVQAEVGAVGAVVRSQSAATAALPDLGAATAAIGDRVTAIDVRLDKLSAAVTELASEVSLLAEARPTDLNGGSRAEASFALALDHVGRRLTAIEGSAARAATDTRAIAEQVAPVPARLSAMAKQVDRITPLARATDRVAALFEQLDRIEAGLAAVRGQPSARPDGPTDLEPLDADRDVLAVIAHRQEEVMADLAELLDEGRGRNDVDSILDRLDRLELSLAVGLRGIVDGTGGAEVMDVLMGILEHVDTLSRLVTGTSKASSAEIDDLKQRVSRSLAAVDAVGAGLKKELAARSSLTDDDVRRIADAVTQSLLESVRVETG